MKLPFSVEQFFAVFRTYNEAVWPAQWLLLALALALVSLLFVKRAWASMAISAGLAGLWAWVGIAYHLVHFTAINPLAWAFGAVALAGAALFLWWGVLRRELRFELHRDARSVIGGALVVYALLVYPWWSMRVGHAYPELPTFGLPCPTTIFTLGLLALVRGAHARSAFAVPVLWSLIGGQAAFLLDVPPDFGLLVAGLLGIVLAWRRPPEAARLERAVGPA